MKLSEITGKHVYAGNRFKGVCLGVGISLKNGAIKYLLCRSTNERSVLPPHADFAVNASAVTEIGAQIRLSRLRPVHPKSCARLFGGLPVFSFEGAFLGKLQDLEMHDFVATRLYTDQGKSFSALRIAACSDAVLLRKEQPYPLGQRIPAPHLFHIDEAVVTKSVLRTASEEGKLIKLTLSLPPFRHLP